MSRNPSTCQVRAMATIAFRRFHRQQDVPHVRRPDPDETPLSASEVEHGVREGLIPAGAHIAPARAFSGA